MGGRAALFRDQRLLHLGHRRCDLAARAPAGHILRPPSASYLSAVLDSLGDPRAYGRLARRSVRRPVYFGAQCLSPPRLAVALAVVGQHHAYGELALASRRPRSGVLLGPRVEAVLRGAVLASCGAA